MASDSMSAAETPDLNTFVVNAHQKKRSDMSVFASLAQNDEESTCSSDTDAKSQTTFDSDKAKVVLGQLMSIVEESDDDPVIFEKSLPSPRSRHISRFNNNGVVSNRSTKNSPSIGSGRSQAADDTSSFGGGISHISHYTEGTAQTGLKTTIAGNLTSQKNEKRNQEFSFFSDDDETEDEAESMGPQRTKGQKASTTSNNAPSVRGIPSDHRKQLIAQIAAIANDKVQDSQIISNSNIKQKGGDVTPLARNKRQSGQSGQATTPLANNKTGIGKAATRSNTKRHHEKENRTASENDVMDVENAQSNESNGTDANNFALAIGSDDSTAKGSGCASITKRNELPHWAVVSFLICAAVAFIAAAVFTVIALPEILQKTTGKKSPGTATRMKTMKDIATSVSGNITLDDKNSPQYKAFDWLVRSDNVSLKASRSALIERYIITLLYYATGGEGWKSQNNFLSAGSICEWNQADAGKILPAGITCDEQSNVKHIVLGESW